MAGAGVKRKAPIRAAVMPDMKLARENLAIYKIAY
jgi:hypothetical protein